MRQTHGGETNAKQDEYTGLWYGGIDNIAECLRATQLKFDTVFLDHEQHAEDFVAVDVASRRRILKVTGAGPCSSGIEIHCEIGTTAKVIGRNDDSDANEELNGSVHVQ